MGQAEDTSEVRIFLAEEEARTLYQLRVRAFSYVAGDSSTTVADVVMVLSNLRHNNMVSYEARYPAAVEVRNNLGDEIWDGLEDYRCGVAYLAFSTLRQQRKASIDFPVGLRAFLNQNIPHMKTYIKARFGKHDMHRFQWCHEDLEDSIEEEREEGIEAQEAWPMHFIVSSPACFLACLQPLLSRGGKDELGASVDVGHPMFEEDKHGALRGQSSFEFCMSGTDLERGCTRIVCRHETAIQIDSFLSLGCLKYIVDLRRCSVEVFSFQQCSDSGIDRP